MCLGMNIQDLIIQQIYLFFTNVYNPYSFQEYIFVDDFHGMVPYSHKKFEKIHNPYMFPVLRNYNVFEENVIDSSEVERSIVILS